jgi:hypothetical protein
VQKKQKIKKEHVLHTRYTGPSKPTAKNPNSELALYYYTRYLGPPAPKVLTPFLDFELTRVGVCLSERERRDEKRP